MALVFSPLWLLRKVNVNRGLRFRLLSAFFVSIATTIAAVAHAILVIALPGAYEVIVSTRSSFAEQKPDKTTKIVRCCGGQCSLLVELDPCSLYSGRSRVDCLQRLCDHPHISS